MRAPQSSETPWRWTLRCPSTSSSSTGSSSGSPATPATACSSPATGSRRRRRRSATTCRRCRTSRPRSARPQGTLPGVSSFQLHFADHDILTPGDRPDVLVAMNPAALKANLGDLPKGAHDHRRHRRLHRPQPRQGRLTANPLEDGTLDEYNVHAVDLTPLTVEALEELELSRKDAGRAKNMFALGLLSWLYSRPTEGDDRRSCGKKFANKPEIARRQRRGVQGGLELRRDDRDVRGPLRGQAGPDGDGHLPQHHRQRWRWPTAWSPPRSGPGCRCSSAPTRSRRRRTSCTSWPSTSASASRRSRPRTRSPASARPSARRSAARSG